MDVPLHPDRCPHCGFPGTDDIVDSRRGVMVVRCDRCRRRRHGEPVPAETWADSRAHLLELIGGDDVGAVDRWLRRCGDEDLVVDHLGDEGLVVRHWTMGGSELVELRFPFDLSMLWAEVESVVERSLVCPACGETHNPGYCTFW